MFALSNEKSAGRTMQCHLVIAYGVFILSAQAVWHLVAEGEFSAVLTMSVMGQCLSLVLLALQLISTGSASGISARSLSLDALAICCRMSSTLWLNGYLPVDATGDYVFQCIDICSLCILGWLLYQVLVTNNATYQSEGDSLAIRHLVVCALILACFLHGDMNSRPIFDTLWMTGLFVSAVAVLPQLWLITRSSTGHVEALTSHYIAAMAASRILSGIFMWHARFDITCKPWIGQVNHASWAILGAHLLHMLLLGDFGYCYFKSVLKNGLNSPVEIMEVVDCV